MNPRYKLSLNGNDIDNSPISCSGTQLKNILSKVSHIITTENWFACDITTLSNDDEWKKFNSYDPQFFGSTTELIIAVGCIEQFLSGVFLVKASGDTSGFSDSYSTEDEPYRENEMALIEIRAFDTDLFEIYSSNQIMLETIGTEFNKDIDVINKES